MSAAITFSKNKSLSGPIGYAFDITLNNSTDIGYETRGVYVGVSGNLKVDLVGTGTVTFTNLAAGVIHPIRAKRVYATGTTATGIIGVF